MNASPRRLPVSRYAAWLVAALLGAGALAAIATESGDLQTGLDAFNRGDLITAMRHYRRAAEAGLPEAQVRLAWILDQAEENAEAAAWYRRAAEQDDVEGQAGLAEMYAKGEGVPQDDALALQWFERAAAHGHQGAMSVLAAAYRNGELGVARDADIAAQWKSRLAAAQQRSAEKGSDE